jgi:hypothetical protein
MIDDMGIFRTTIAVKHPARPGATMQVENVMVDTGSERCHALIHEYSTRPCNQSSSGRRAAKCSATSPSRSPLARPGQCLEYGPFLDVGVARHRPLCLRRIHVRPPATVSSVAAATSGTGALTVESEWCWVRSHEN